jgi:hypothetical protein
MFCCEKRRMVANFRGALDGRLLASVTWRTDAPEIGVMSDAQISIDRRETSILFASRLGGLATLRCDATLDDGSIMTQVFRVNVREASGDFDDPDILTGPVSLTVNAPA